MKVAYICSECGRVKVKEHDEMESSPDFITCKCGGSMKNLRTLNRLIKGCADGIHISCPMYDSETTLMFATEIIELSEMIETLIENS